MGLSSIKEVYGGIVEHKGVYGGVFGHKGMYGGVHSQIPHMATPSQTQHHGHGIVRSLKR